MQPLWPLPVPPVKLKFLLRVSSRSSSGLLGVWPSGEEWFLETNLCTCVDDREPNVGQLTERSSPSKKFSSLYEPVIRIVPSFYILNCLSRKCVFSGGLDRNTYIASLLLGRQSLTQDSLCVTAAGRTRPALLWEEPPSCSLGPALTCSLAPLPLSWFASSGPFLMPDTLCPGSLPGDIFESLRLTSDGERPSQPF